VPATLVSELAEKYLLGELVEGLQLFPALSGQNMGILDSKSGILEQNTSLVVVLFEHSLYIHVKLFGIK
jgi:hypothetical protein